MKRNLTVLIFALCALSLLVSCSKDSDPTPTPQPTKEIPVELIVTVYPGQEQYITQEYTIDVNGKVTSVDISKMTKITDLSAAKYSSLKTALKFIYDWSKVELKYDVYRYSLGNIEKGKIVKCTKIVYGKKESRPSTETVDLLFGYGLYGNEDGAIYEPSLRLGLYNDDSRLSYGLSIIQSDYNKNGLVSYTCIK